MSSDKCKLQNVIIQSLFFTENCNLYESILPASPPPPPRCLAHYFRSSGLAKLLAMVRAAHGEQGSSGQGVVLCWLTALETEPESTATLPLRRTHCTETAETPEHCNVSYTDSYTCTVC